MFTSLRVCAPLSFALLLAACSSSSDGPGATADAASGGDTGTLTPGGDALAGDALLGETAADSAPPPDAAARLERLLIGEYDSSAQAASDKSFFSIHLVVCKIDAPAIGPRVLYVEQARSEMLKAPYRQRLYVLEGREPKATVAVSRIFEFAAPDPVIGLCANPSKRAVKPSDVTERAGCDVELSWIDDHFEGRTKGKECASALNGASYATSEATLDDAGLRSWDRGYDAADKQVWGAVKGPYVFDRKSTLAPE